jgi:hypothetical protein
MKLTDNISNEKVSNTLQQSRVKDFQIFLEQNQANGEWGLHNPNTRESIVVYHWSYDKSVGKKHSHLLPHVIPVYDHYTSSIKSFMITPDLTREVGEISICWED